MNASSRCILTCFSYVLTLMCPLKGSGHNGLVFYIVVVLQDSIRFVDFSFSVHPHGKHFFLLQTSDGVESFVPYLVNVKLNGRHENFIYLGFIVCLKTLTVVNECLANLLSKTFSLMSVTATNYITVHFFLDRFLYPKNVS